VRPLPKVLRILLTELIGPGSAYPSARVASLAASRMSATQQAALTNLGSIVSAEDRARSWAMRGMALIDVVGARPGSPPDAVVRPTTTQAVQAVIDWCVREQVAVVPRGGGTSVVGGLVGPPGIWISLDVGELRSVSAPIAGTVVVGPGVTGPELEASLAPEGLTFGHLPQSWERATIGGYAATRSAGQNSSGYGRIEDLVLAAQLATPIGPWQVGSIPASAVGPDLLRYVLGSEGTLGVFTELTLRTRPIPQVQLAEGALAPSWDAGVAAAEDLAQQGCVPTVLRISDVHETFVTMQTAPAVLRNYARLRGMPQGCLIVLDWHGSMASVSAQRHDAWRVLRSHRIARLGKRVGTAWREHRFDGPYLRDQLIDGGYFVETFETAASWPQLTDAYDVILQRVRDCYPGAYVMCHISHVYPTGASLYFTLIGDAAMVHAWPDAKTQITDCVRSLGLTASHHHGVGTDHAAWLADEIGSVGVQVLSAVKRTVDPQNIMNPVLLSHA